MSLRREDGVSSLCQKALHIVTELCFAGQVEWERCAGIFPPERGGQGGASSTGESRERGPSLQGVRAPGVPRGHLWLEQLRSGTRGSGRAARAHVVVAAKFRGARCHAELGPPAGFVFAPPRGSGGARVAPGPGEVLQGSSEPKAGRAESGRQGCLLPLTSAGCEYGGAPGWGDSYPDRPGVPSFCMLGARASFCSSATRVARQQVRAGGGLRARGHSVTPPLGQIGDRGGISSQIGPLESPTQGPYGI